MAHAEVGGSKSATVNSDFPLTPGDVIEVDQNAPGALAK